MLKKITGDYLQARKDKDTAKKTILGVLLGEIQLEETRNGSLDEAGILKAIKKLKKGCVDMANRGVDGAQDEVDLLDVYLPSVISHEEIRVVILCSGLLKKIHQAPNAMRLIGEVSATLSKQGLIFDGKDVAIVVKQLADAKKRVDNA